MDLSPDIEGPYVMTSHVGLSIGSLEDSDGPYHSATDSESDELTTKPCHHSESSLSCRSEEDVFHSEEGDVILPSRFSNSSLLRESPGDLHSDIECALHWIRQELCRMKTQDQSLLRQFKLLRSAITDLQHSTPGNSQLAQSCQSLPVARCQSLSISSCKSLDLGGFANRDWSPISDKDVFIDFKLSALNPKSSPSTSMPCTPITERSIMEDFISAPASAKLNRTLWSATRKENLGVWYV